MKNRIKQIRKTLDLTQQAFAERIGIKRNTIANYEAGRNDPVDSVISLICREFNVREEFLRTGEGEMFNPRPSNVLDQLAQEYHLSRADYIMIKKFISLRPEARTAIFDYLHEIDVALSSESIHPYTPVEKTVEELESEYKKNVLHSAAETDSTVSNTIGDIERKVSGH